MGVKFPSIPPEVKPIAHLLKLADEHDERNIVVAYWARMAACRLALRLVPGKKTPETAGLIRDILDWLEVTKKENSDNEGINNETAAQAIIENYALKMFEYGDQQDSAEIFNKNTVKTFYTAGMLMDVLDQFGSLSDEIREKRKYSKWKAAYIHNCLKNGEQPMPGPPRAANENPGSGIVHNSQLSEDELATYTKYTGPIDFNETKKKPPTSQTPIQPPADLLSFGMPVPGFAHAPASSPVTPQAPPEDAPVPQPPEKPTPAPILTPDAAPIMPQRQESGNGNGGGGYQPTPEVIQKAQKFCKFATSALNYDDVKNALEYIEKARGLLLSGEE